MKNKPAIIGAVPPPNALAMMMAISIGSKVKKLSEVNDTTTTDATLLNYSKHNVDNMIKLHDITKASKKVKKAKAKKTGFIKTGK